MASNRRVLIVACGGTGQLILKNCLKVIAPTGYTSLPTHVAVAMIDAHAGSPEVPGLSEYPFSRTYAIEFPREHARLIEERDSGLADWWPSRVKPQATNTFDDGCGAYRCNGKFFVFRYANTIEDTLTRAIEKLTRLQMYDAGEGITFECYILASTGNGTGGGTHKTIGAFVKNYITGLNYHTPQITGLFIPASVTGRYQRQSAPKTGARVTAAGFGALVEMQYEFNRFSGDPALTWRPNAPYTSISYKDGAYQQFMLDDGVSPLDRVFLIDGKNRKGRTTWDRDILCERAGQGLAQLIRGGDSDNRLLDYLNSAQDERRFGSFGISRISAPITDLTEFSTYTMLANALRASSTREMDASWTDLIKDKAGTLQYPSGGDEATLEGSVDFFIDHVLRIKETSLAGNDATSHEDVFALFAEADSILTAKFKQIIQGASESGDIREIAEGADQLSNWVTRTARDLPATRTQILNDFWKRVPEDELVNYDEVESVDNVGPCWLLEKRVMQFVNAGAFGPLAAWLTELIRQTKKNQDSILTYTTQKYLDGKDANIDLDQAISRLQDKANSVFSMFSKSAINEQAQVIQEDAREKYEFLLWKAKIEAATAFYQTALDHMGMLLTGAKEAAALLGGAELLKFYDRCADTFRDNLENRAERGDGVNVYVGGDEAMRQDLIDALANNPKTNAHQFLACMADQNQKLFRSGLGANAKLLLDYDPGNKPFNLERELPSYKSQLETEAKNKTRAVVGGKIDIQNLLETQARKLIEDYYYKAMLKTQEGQSLDSEGRDATDRLINTYGPDFPLRIDELFQREKDRPPEENIEKCIAIALAERMNDLIGMATPQFNLTNMVGLKAQQIEGMAFLAVNEKHGKILTALDSIKATGTGVAKKLHFSKSTSVNPSALICVFLEVGAKLDWIDMNTEIRFYEDCMKGMPNPDPGKPIFSDANPHTTKQYEEAGTAWIQNRREAQKAAGRIASDGGVILALAELQLPTFPELFGQINNNGGHYYLTKGINQLYENGQEVFDAPGNWPQGKFGPKGLDRVVNWLDGEKIEDHEGQEGKALCDALKHLLWKDIHTWIWGDSNATPPIVGEGLTGVVNEINRLSGQMAQEADGKGFKSTQKARAAQAEGLRRLAGDLMKGQGAKTAMFETR